MWYSFSKRKLRLNICKYILKFTSFSLIICMIELENQLTYLLFKVLFVRSISNSISTYVCTCLSFRALNIWTRKRCLFRTKKMETCLKTWSITLAISLLVICQNITALLSTRQWKKQTNKKRKQTYKLKEQNYNNRKPWGNSYLNGVLGYLIILLW